MREELKKIHGKRRRFEGTFSVFGSKSAYKGPPLPTALFINIRDVAAAKEVTDHIWVTVGKRIAKLDLKPGDKVRFDARVTSYLKGYVHRGEDNRTVDYRLSFPTNFIKWTPMQSA